MRLRYHTSGTRGSTAVFHSMEKILFVLRRWKRIDHPDMKKYFLSSSLTLLGLAAVAHSGPIATEDFDYAPGAIAGLNGPSGFAGAWRGSGSVDATGLTYPGLLSDGGRFASAGGNSGAFRDLGAFYGTDGTTVFVSVLVSGQPGVSGNNPDYAGLSFLDAGDNNERLFLGKTFLATNYGFERSGGATTLSGTAVSASTTFLVAEFNFLPGNDTVNLYVNPTPGIAAPDVVPFSASVADFFFDRIRLQSGLDGGESFNFDAVRLATTYAEVSPAPEPTSMLLLGLAGVGLLARRRR